MSKTKENILQELNLSTSSSLVQLLNKLNEYSVVMGSEIVGVKNVSVNTLPSVVKNSEQTVKEKMFGIVTDENRGAVALMNKRNVLIAKIIEMLKSNQDSLQETVSQQNESLQNAIIRIANNEYNISQKLNKQIPSEYSAYVVTEDGTQTTTQISEGAVVGTIVKRRSDSSIQAVTPDNPSDLAVANVLYVNRLINSLERDLDNLSQNLGIKNLGDIGVYPITSTTNEKLNAITTAGLYTFTQVSSYSGGNFHSRNVCFMMVETFDVDVEKIVQYIHAYDIDTRMSDKHYGTYIVKRVYDGTTWSVYQMDIASREYVDSKFNQILGEGAVETLDTIGEISKALEDDAGIIGTLATKSQVANLDANKADKKEVPTKLSQLEIDVPVGGVSEEQVLDIIEENGEEVDALNIGTSTAYNENSDSEVPTTKAVASMIGALGGSSEAKLVATGTIDMENSEGGSVIYNLSNELTPNRLYLIERYEDEVGTWSYAMIVVKEDNGWISSNYLTRMRAPEADFDTFQQVIVEYINAYPLTQIHLRDEDYSLLYGESDILNVYELPFTLGGNE